jgi:alpha-galactosidase/6-phospho-beta-glucosidase family protein
MKVTIIGGGSFQWTPTLAGDLLDLETLPDLHVVLEDIDPAPLPKMRTFVEKLAAERGRSVTVETTTDQRAALRGADFVVVTISTGGFASMRHDLEIPERYGLRQSVGDTVGPGGVSRALRNIPVLLGIARDMEELCPEAWLLNITNPMTTLTRVVARETSVRVVGLCHEMYHFREDLAAALERPVEEIRAVMTGVNHLPVVTELRAGGDDLLAWLRALVDAPPAAESPEGRFASRHALKLHLLSRFGALPAAGDRHVAEFFPFVLTPESGWGARWNVALTTIEERERVWLRWFTDLLDLMLAGKHSMPKGQSGEMVAPVIESLVNGTHRELPLNRPNGGQAPDLPADVVVESICVVDSDGIRPRDSVVASPPLAEWIRRHVANQELTVQAAVSGDRDLAVAAYAGDPLTGRLDLEQIESMAADLLAATGPWLPQFSGSTP